MSASPYAVTALAPFPEVLLIQCKVFGDTRGFFLESFNEKAFRGATGVQLPFVQDNHSRSAKGVLRGIHYQLPPHAQGKLVRVAHGAVFDVVVDLRQSSSTFGKWAGAELNDSDGRMLWIPPGFGHAFITLEDGTDFLYKTTDYYAPESEGSVAWNDPTIGIRWPEAFVRNAVLSEKDQAAPPLKTAKLFD